MRKVYIISGTIGLIAVLLIFIYVKWFTDPSIDQVVVQNIILIMATCGAIVSVVFLAFSNSVTVRSLRDTARPSTLVRVVTPKLDKEGEEQRPITRILYENNSNTAFYDLTFSMKIVCDNTIIELSDLFPREMYFAKGDSRQRNFDTYKELMKSGFDLSNIAQSGKSVYLNISYKYTFGGEQETVQIQNYQWNADREEWQIES